MKKTAVKPARKPVAVKSVRRPERVTPEFLATLPPDIRRLHEMAKELRRVLA